MKIAYFDFTDLLTKHRKNELYEIANAKGILDIYKSASDKDMDYRTAEKYIDLLAGDDINWIAEIIDKAEPSEGVIEAIKKLKEKGFEIVVVSDNPLISEAPVQKRIKAKYLADKILTTSYVETENGKIKPNLYGYIPKERLIELHMEVYSPEEVIGVFQGSNDLGACDKVVNYGYNVITVNSNNKKLRQIGEGYGNKWIPDTCGLPDAVDYMIRMSWVAEERPQPKFLLHASSNAKNAEQINRIASEFNSLSPDIPGFNARKKSLSKRYEKLTAEQAKIQVKA